MPLIPPEVAAMARVRVVVSRGGQVSASYEFANGFDSAAVQGAAYGAPVIGVTPLNEIVLFLTQPLGPGSASTPSEGGLKARVDVVKVATPLVAPSLDPFLEVRWYYGNYALAGVAPAPAYKDVDPQKAITIQLSATSLEVLQTEALLDIVVFRNVMATYKPPVIYGTLVPVKVFPP